MSLLYAAVGGAFGSAARYVLASLIARHAPAHAAAGTFVVNVLGCFLFGLIAALADRRFPLPAPARAFVLAGVLGGFTTFSSYTFDTFMLLREGQIVRAVWNAAGQVVLGMAALGMGYAMVRDF